MKDEQNKPVVIKNQYVPTAEFYSQVIDSLQDYSIFTVDTDLVINSWNSGATKIFQYETDEITGKKFEVIFTEEDRKSGAPAIEIETASRDGRAVDNKWHIRKDGSKFYAYGLVFPFLGINGEMLGYVKILRDLTERKKSEDSIAKYVKELEELNTHKESVLAILSHDLRSPLAGIISTAEYLKLNYDKLEPGVAKEMLDLLHKSSKEELNMLDYLVEWARIKYAADVFTPAKINLAEYVRKVFDTLSENASIKAINLHHEIHENISVFADGKMVLSILQNIVSNALKHTEAGGSITVKTKKKEDKIIIEIKDTGIGMDREIQEKLFTPQARSLSKAREKDKGAGIGLLLVKGFLEKNGGEIWVESVPGEGTSFYFTLPLEKPLTVIENLKKIDDVA
ncbi:MAG TPA: PAS domain-containing sensor histidine kinase [Bacteroidia bacterium]|jgi:two-component system CheB/CheR fusion protein|nr:PAS domain-containing sensor histidine kinase [Bacteroidia bacterium]